MLEAFCDANRIPTVSEPFQYYCTSLFMLACVVLVQAQIPSIQYCNMRSDTTADMSSYCVYTHICCVF